MQSFCRSGIAALALVGVALAGPAGCDQQTPVTEETIQGAWEGMSGLKITFDFRSDGKYVMHVEDSGAEVGAGIFFLSGYGAIPYSGDYDVRDGHISFRNIDGTPATGADVVYLTAREMHLRLPEKPAVRFRATTPPPAPAFVGFTWGDDEDDDPFDGFDPD